MDWEMGTKVQIGATLGLVFIYGLMGLGIHAAGEQPQSQTTLPPAGSPPLFTTIELRFPTQGNVASVEFQTYLYYMEIDDTSVFHHKVVGLPLMRLSSKCYWLIISGCGTQGS